MSNDFSNVYPNNWEVIAYINGSAVYHKQNLSIDTDQRFAEYVARCLPSPFFFPDGEAFAYS